MGVSEENDEAVRKSFDDLCLSLNMDRTTQEEAWEAFERISRNYTLEGESLHWLACALYVACRNTIIPTVGSGQVEGNFVSLTRLLRSTKLSLLEFFKKIRKWANMANLPQELREKVDKLERNFAVSSVIFKKFGPIFLDIFQDPAKDQPKPPRSRKQKRLPCSVSEVFNFTWTMFVQVKGNFRAISDDLVNSYHLLLCCIDWIYVNSLLSNRRDLINPSFSGLPEAFDSRDYKPPTDVPCLIEHLCKKHDGVIIEAKGIKEHWWKPHIKKLFEKKVLKGKLENLTGILELGQYEQNSKAITQRYEEYVLNVGDFDERIFLDSNADEEIGTPAKPGSYAASELHEQMMKKSFRQTVVENSRLAPSTPLTGRRYLKEKNETFTPVTTATQSVHRLQALLSGRKVGPSEALLEMCSQCTKNPRDEIMQRMREMGEVFCREFSAPNTDDVPLALDFTKKRLQLAESLYYKELEQIMTNERRKIQSKNPANNDLSGVMGQDMFHKALIACSLEIVIYSYNSQRTFPWIANIFEVDAFYFYKVIELVIRGEEGLSRDVVKHLSYIEESIIECSVWRSSSPLWACVDLWLADHGGILPSVEDVHFPSQIEKDGVPAVGAPSLAVSSLSSPIQHPAVRRLATDTANSSLRKDLQQSPTGPSAVDFMSPVTTSAKRKLFTSTESSAASTPTITPAATPAATPSTTPLNSSPAKVPTITNSYQLIHTNDGKKMLIQIPLSVLSPVREKLSVDSSAAAGAAGDKQTENISPNITGNSKLTSPSTTAATAAKPKCTGSFALFLRKLYHLASVRLQDLCEKLDLDSELHRQIWTCFEYTLMHHIALLKDRHIDQLLMCSVYVMCKVTRKERSFQDIMKCYRLQPQAQSHVYRSILLSVRKRLSTESNGTEEPPAKKSKESVQLPASDPPTPTRMAGTQSAFEFDDRGEQRGDLIHFYNSIFVEKIKEFSLKFATDEVSDMPVLSPLPLARCQQLSPRRISNKHSVFVSHRETKDPVLTPTTKLLYCFNRSPATDLRAINNMLRMNEKGHQASKRVLHMEPGSTSAKKICLGNSSPMPMFQKKLQNVVNERKATNGMDG